MKKIFTLFFSLALVSVAAFAQERHHQKDGGYNNSFESYYNGFKDGYGHNWNDKGYGQFDHDRKFHEREWNERKRWLRRHHYRIYENPGYNNHDFGQFGHKGKLSLEVVIGRKHSF